jgi:hypothetical protein
MSVRIEGEIYIDVSDHDEDLRVSIDNPSDLYDLMCENGITEEDMLEYFTDSQSHTKDSITEWLKAYADMAELCDISRTCAEMMLHYWNDQHSARVELTRRLREVETSSDKPTVHMTN